MEPNLRKIMSSVVERLKDFFSSRFSSDVTVHPAGAPGTNIERRQGPSRKGFVQGTPDLR